MSKLYSEYVKLKEQNNKKIYLFKSGIFYISLQDDAQKLAEMFNFKIINLNDKITKCGFPLKRLDFYVNLLNQNHVDFEIVDNNYSKIENYSDYLKNENIKKIINSIQSLDMDNITFRESFEFLSDLKNKLSQIYTKI